MFGFGKKKAAVDKPNKQPKKHNDSRDKYKDALARVVEGNKLDEAELDDMTSGIDDLDLDNLDDDLDIELNAVKQREPVDNVDDIDDMDILDDDTDLEELAESLPDDEPDDESFDVLSHKPVKVVDEKTKRLRELQETDINDIGSDAFDGFTTKDAELLLGDIVEDEDFEEDDDLDDVEDSDNDLESVSEFEDPNEYDDPNVDLLDDEDSSSTDEDNDLLSDFDLNDE